MGRRAFVRAQSQAAPKAAPASSNQPVLIYSSQPARETLPDGWAGIVHENGSTYIRSYKDGVFRSIELTAIP